MSPVAVADLVVEEAGRVEEVPRTEWDAVAAGAAVYSSHAWLRFVETFGDCEHRYLLVRRDGELVAALPVYRFEGAIPRYYDPQYYGAPAGSPVVLGGTRHGYSSEYLIRPGLSEDVRAAAVAALLERLRAEDAAATAVLYLTDDALAMTPSSPDDRVFLLDAHARLPVEPSGLAGYRAAVSENTAARMRKEMRKFADAGCRAEVLRLSECHEHLGELSARVLRRYGHEITAEAEAGRFAEQVATMDDICHVVLARQGGRVVGFTQFFGWGSTLFGRVHGLDDDMARSAALYYNLTYYHAIEFAAANGFTAIDLGCDSYEAKVRRGARLHPLWGLATAPGWDADTTREIADRARARAEEFAAWDPRMNTAVPHPHLETR
ncbi:GNAT family N-acetyltransferase [Lentzea albidocapillata]|uniref:GNAT family N-acetyltransferase n=1 Tax=Lentzea albidocapillata TaxID=40571 RepID=A0A1W2ER37_9PSEU|nr:GNAT family N-acetyltransferase [Lentzea albidocapillata]SMD12151.1 hypothetical protein SAMN05660733_04383 [Lentzea albidocapillata]